MTWTVGKKLYAGFLILVALLVWVSSTSIIKMNSMNEDVQYIANDPLPGVEEINKINYLTERLLTTDLKYVMESDPAALESMAKDAENILAEIDAAFARYDSTITTQEDRDTFDQLKKEWQKYLPQHQQYIALGKSMSIEKSTVSQQAQIKDLNRLSWVAFNEMQVHLDKLVQFNHDNAIRGSEQAEASYSSAKTVTLIAVIISLIIAAVLSAVLTRSISIPVQQVSEALQRMAEGDLTQKEIQVRNQDEIGTMAKSFNLMAKQFYALISRVNVNTELVTATSEELYAGSEQASKASEQITVAMQDVAAGAEKQVAEVTEATRIVGEIVRGMDEAAHSVEAVADLAGSTNQKAVAGTQIMHETVQQMNVVHQHVSSAEKLVNSLGENSKEIGRIVDMITQISGQTNLLALNAAIEAARAGENGRGFAVVAGEIRKLAEQSGIAAGEIVERIQQIQTDTDNAVHAMSEGAMSVDLGIRKVRETGAVFQDIAAMIDEVSTQSQEVSSIIEQVNAGSQNMVEMLDRITQISEQSAANTQQVAASAEEQNASMEEVSASADELSRMAQELQDAVSKFKL
jgi:methyl-accepting chemotaxis protein